jgi:hypothetical protein
MCFLFWRVCNGIDFGSLKDYARAVKNSNFKPKTQEANASAPLSKAEQTLAEAMKNFPIPETSKLQVLILKELGKKQFLGALNVAITKATVKM